MPILEKQTSDAGGEASPEKATLPQAFERFQEHCEKLDAAQLALRKRLARAELRLQEKNRELARRLREIDVMKSRLSTIIESIPDALFVINGEAAIELANTAARELFGSVQTGAPLGDAVPAVRHVVDSAGPVRNVEISLPAESGERTLMATLTRLSDRPESGGTRILVLKDVTEYRLLKERLERDNRLAALGEVAANVAHEIRNPLGAIEGFGRLLEQDLRASDPDAVRLLSRMIFAANQMNRVVGNLLNYTRQTPVRYVEGTLSDIVRDVLDMMELKATECGVEVCLRVAAPEEPCRFDPVRMKEVMTNLVSNAIQACVTRSGARVHVEAACDQGAAELSVRDNGKGIPEDALDRIFEPFYTLKNDGIGLGLALSKRIVEEHDGTISAENNPDGGACFRIRIPRRPAGGWKQRAGIVTKRELPVEAEHD